MKTKRDIPHQVDAVVRWLFFGALNPTTTTRLWRVTYGGWNGSRFKCFWFKKNAIKFAEIQNDLFVNLENELTGKCIRIRDNPKKVQPPIRYISI